MSAAERKEVEAKVRSFVPSETTRGWKMAVLAALFTAGAQELLPEVEGLLMSDAKFEDRASSVANIVGHLLANVAPHDVEGRVRELLTSARSNGSPACDRSTLRVNDDLTCKIVRKARKRGISRI